MPLIGIIPADKKTLDEAVEAHILEGVASLKSHDNYTFEHSVDVAFYGVMLGRRLNLDLTVRS